MMITRKRILFFLTFVYSNGFILWDVFPISDRLAAILSATRECLYEGRVEDADSLFMMVDSLNLNSIDLGYYYLTRAFLNQKKGKQSIAINYIQKATDIFHKYGGKEDKAEADLIWGLMFEGVSLKTEAAKKYFESLDYYLNKEDAPEYFYNLLGLTRTVDAGEKYLASAENFVKKHTERKYRALYYYTKATCLDDPEQRQKLFLQAIENNDQLIDVRK